MENGKDSKNLWLKLENAAGFSIISCSKLYIVFRLSDNDFSMSLQDTIGYIKSVRERLRFSELFRVIAMELAMIAILLKGLVFIYA